MFIFQKINSQFYSPSIAEAPPNVYTIGESVSEVSYFAFMQSQRLGLVFNVWISALKGTGTLERNREGLRCLLSEGRSFQTNRKIGDKTTAVESVWGSQQLHWFLVSLVGKLLEFCAGHATGNGHHTHHIAANGIPAFCLIYSHVYVLALQVSGCSETEVGPSYTIPKVYGRYVFIPSPSPWERNSPELGNSLLVQFSVDCWDETVQVGGSGSSFLFMWLFSGVLFHCAAEVS